MMRSVGVVGESRAEGDSPADGEPPAARVVEAASAAAEAGDVTVSQGQASDVLATDPEAVVAVGESALLALVRDGLDVPVLPVGAGPGYGGVDPENDDAVEADLAGAVEALLAGDAATESRAVLDVSLDGEHAGRALADAMLVTAEPSRISEYGVRSDGERVERFRADGVVVSTPTGSHGYGRSAGGPLLEPGSGVVGVVAVAPFAVNVDHWVLSGDSPVTLRVERDEGEVSLLLDDRTVGEVPPNTPVEIRADDAIDVVRVPGSQSFFER